MSKRIFLKFYKTNFSNIKTSISSLFACLFVYKYRTSEDAIENTQSNPSLTVKSMSVHHELTLKRSSLR